MDPLVQASLALRRALRRGYGTVLVGALAAYVVFAGAGPRASGGVTGPVGAGLTIAATTWALLLGWRMRAKLSCVGDAPLLLDVELGALLAVGLDAALLRFEGDLSGTLSPAVYVLVALVAAFSRPLSGLLVVVFVVMLEAAIRSVRFGELATETMATHAAFVAVFALLHVLLLRAEVARIRITARADVDREIATLHEDARSYRLLGAGGGDEARAHEGGEERIARSSVEEIHESVHYALDLLRRSLDLHTAVLLWLNDAGTHLRISELTTASEEIHDAPFPAGDGILGAVVLRRERVTVHNLKPSSKIPYYAGPCPVKVLAALPVFEDGALRGVLAIDRVAAKPFRAHEEDVAAQAARFCLRAIQNERTFVQLERAKVEQGKLYRAAKALGSALAENDVLDEAARAAREIASFDFAAVTVFDEDTKTHEVRAARGDDGAIDGLVGAKFVHNTGLVSMVVQNRCPLPYRGEFDPAQQIVLAKRFAWPRMPSLLVLPLLVHERALGTLVLGARRRHAFGESVRPPLELLASHVAVSLSNARMVKKLATMATTDGMTGLFNKRALLEAASQKIAAAVRFRRQLALLVVDIDFFKKVNDTYGHDVGDVVIRGLAEVLRRQKRATDVVARYGGEEFVVLCEQTDDAGALLLAERIREELARSTFHTPNGTLAVTCSIGIATLPDAGADWDALFKAADEALYVSKRSGRNRSTAWHSRRAARAVRAPAPTSTRAGTPRPGTPRPGTPRPKAVS